MAAISVTSAWVLLSGRLVHRVASNPIGFSAASWPFHVSRTQPKAPAGIRTGWPSLSVVLRSMTFASRTRSLNGGESSGKARGRASISRSNGGGTALRAAWVARASRTAARASAGRMNTCALAHLQLREIRPRLTSWALSFSNQKSWLPSCWGETMIGIWPWGETGSTPRSTAAPLRCRETLLSVPRYCIKKVMPNTTPTRTTSANTHFPGFMKRIPEEKKAG